MPTAAEDVVEVEVDHQPTLSIYGGSVRALTIRQGSRVLLLHHAAALDRRATLEMEGFSASAGAAACQTSDECFYYYQHVLDVTVPGGATGTVAPGATARLGDYLVLHGDTGSKSPVAAFAPSVLVNDCADRPARSNQLTAILQPEAG